MPYILEEPEENRHALAQDLNVLMAHSLRIIGDNRRSGKHLFFFFLITLFECLQERIMTEDKVLRHWHFNHLSGAFDGAGKILWRRFGELIPLRPPRVLDREALEHLGETTKRSIKEADRDYVRLLVRNLVSVFRYDLNTMVGEINFSITEVANMLANSEKVTHQDIVHMVAASSVYLYFTYIGPYENVVLNRDGDTAGFKRFYELNEPKLRS